MKGTKRNGIRVFVSAEMIFIMVIQGILPVISSLSEVYDPEVNVSLTAFACERSELTIRCKGNERIHIEYANYGRLTSDICYIAGHNGDTNCSSNSSRSIVQSLCSGKSNCAVNASNNIFGEPCRGTLKYLGVIHQCYSACSAHCAVGCNVTGTGKCHSCDFGFGLTANGSCDACSANCSGGCNATGAGKCDQCDQGFVLTANGSCERRATEGNVSLTAFACERSELTIRCKGTEQIHIEYANYGRLTSEICYIAGHNGDTNCSSNNSRSIVQSLCSGKSYCAVNASNNVFGDPCRGTLKYLGVIHQCYSADTTANGLYPTTEPSKNTSSALNIGSDPTVMMTTWITSVEIEPIGRQPVENVPCPILEIVLGLGVPCGFIIFVLVIIIIVICVENRSLRKCKKEIENNTESLSSPLMKSFTIL